ncbi:MAG: NAD(P)-dependent oxidoreductase [Anaerolineae bacterium]|nr:NAD(P)-dependent oxidoreductase [Anaerolineae bacterium]
MTRKVLITGAAGRIGSYLTAHLKDDYDFVLTDIRSPAETYGLPFSEANLTDIDAMHKLCEGVDTVIHLAADPSMRAPWESLLPNNLIGVYNVYKAAADAECRRVIFASTVNTISGYHEGVTIWPDMPVHPGNLYGASKVWGEASGYVFADQGVISVICLRFGWVVMPDHPAITPDQRMLDMLLTLPDLTNLVQCSIEAPDSLRYGIFHGVSDNRHKRLDITSAREILGYNPQYDGFAIAEANAQKG